MATSVMSEDYGRRLLPSILQHEARIHPQRIFAVYAKSNVDNLEHAFVEVSFEQIVRAVNNVAYWLQSTFEGGREPRHGETLAYIGVSDLRYSILFYAAIQCRYKVFLPSPRNITDVNVSLLQQLDCTKLVYGKEVSYVAHALQSTASTLPLHSALLPELDELLSTPGSDFVYDLRFADVSTEPVLVLHSSGSTGLPKPVVSTHATLAASDVREYAPVPGHTNEDGVNSFRFPNGRLFDVFPPYHLAGFVLKIVIPLFNLTAPIFGPCSRPPSGDLVAEIVRLQKPRGVCLPPSIIEQMFRVPDGEALLKDLDILGFAGGPLSTSVGNEISKQTQLLQFYGSTEAGKMRQVRLPPEDWEYYRFHPIDSFEFQPEDDGTSELVLFPSEAAKRTSHLYNNYPNIREWRTRDLFLPHPTKPDLWKFHARKDDIIVLSNGEKFNPIPLESQILAIDGVSGALVVGLRRPRAALLVELGERWQDKFSSDPHKELWPEVQRANTLVPSHGRIAESMILLVTDKPLKRAGKGTVIRRLTEEYFTHEIDQLYASENASQEPNRTASISLKPSVFSKDDVKTLLRSILAAVSITDEVSDQQNLFDSGLDSLKAVEVVSYLTSSLQSHVKSPEELKWLSLETVFRNSTIGQLSNLLLQFLNNGIVPRRKDRDVEITSTVEHYVSKLRLDEGTQHYKGAPGLESYSVAITGTTGYLGSFLLNRLMQDSRISHVYALNRSKTAAKIFEERFKNQEYRLARLEFVHVNLSQPKLGLDVEKYAQVQCCNAIIHNAWREDFNLPLSSFEDNLESVRALIELSSTGRETHRPRIFFISSIAATGVWAHGGSSKLLVPESTINDSKLPLEIGYGESKYVAEQLLQASASRFGTPVTIFRTGQIYPSSKPQDHDTWPAGDSMGVFLLACKAMGAVPFDFQDSMEGIAVDRAATVLHDLVRKEVLQPGDGLRVYNVVHPDPAPWTAISKIIAQWCGRPEQVRQVDTQQWVRQLRESDPSTPELRSALRMLMLWELMSQRGPMHAYATEKLLADSENANNLPQLDEELMEMWLSRLSSTV